MEKLVNKELSSDLTWIKQSNSSRKERIEMLERDHENSKKALRSVADSTTNKAISAASETERELNEPSQ